MVYECVRRGVFFGPCFQDVSRVFRWSVRDVYLARRHNDAYANTRMGPNGRPKARSHPPRQARVTTDMYRCAEGPHARQIRKRPSASEAQVPRVVPANRSHGLQFPSATPRGPKRSQAAPGPHAFVRTGLLLTPIRRYAVFGIACTSQDKRNVVTLVLQDSVYRRRWCTVTDHRDRAKR